MAHRPVQSFLPLVSNTSFAHTFEQESPGGFVVNGEVYETVVVQLTSAGEVPEIGPTFLEVERSLIPKGLESRVNPYRRARIRVSLADLKRLKKHVRAGLRDGHRLNQMRSGRSLYREIVIPDGLDQEVTCHLQRMQMAVNPVVLDAQRVALKATGNFPALMQYQEFYHDRFLVQDVLTYRAASVAILHAPKFAGILKAQRNPSISRRSGLGAPRPSLRGRTVRGESWPGITDPRFSLTGLRNWRVLLSPNGKSYRALNITLDHLPPCLPVSLILELHRLKLPRPIEDRAEFLLVTTWSSTDRNQRNSKAFMQARRPEIEKAMSVVSHHVGQALSPNRIRDVQFFVRFLMDSPDIHLGGITGLAKKAVDGHIRLARDAVVQQFRRVAPLSTRLALPPVPLPEDRRIRFLKTVGDIADEAAVMRHCVAQYIRRAIRGRSFLFHVTFHEDEATVEVDPKGRVVQSRGPRNRLNNASRWGEVYLRHWGSAFPTGGSSEDEYLVRDNDVPF